MAAALTETKGGMGVGVAVGVWVAVGVRVAVGVWVCVGVWVAVGVWVCVGTRVAVGVWVIVGVWVMVGVAVGEPARARRLASREVRRRWSSAADTAKPMLSTGRPRSVWSILAVVTPMTSPLRLTRGPPLLPGLTAASVWRRATPSTRRVDDMMPRVTVRLPPS